MSPMRVLASTFRDHCLNNNGHYIFIHGLVLQMLDSEHQILLSSSRNISDQETNSHVVISLKKAEENFSLPRDHDESTEHHQYYTVLQPRCICIVNSHSDCKLEVTPVTLALLFNSEGTLVPKVITANLFQLLLDSAYTKEFSAGTTAIPGLCSSLSLPLRRGLCLPL